MSNQVISREAIERCAIIEGTKPSEGYLCQSRLIHEEVVALLAAARMAHDLLDVTRALRRLHEKVEGIVSAADDPDGECSACDKLITFARRWPGVLP
mgnify:CR=1 FL=1